MIEGKVTERMNLGSGSVLNLDDIPSRTPTPIPTGFRVRRVEKGDYEGVVDALSSLTVVGDLTREEFEETVDYWNELFLPGLNIHVYNVLVIARNTDEKIIAVGSNVLEKKLIHKGGIVGHIEDISVNREFQHKTFGRVLIEHLLEISKSCGCYKTILNCNDANVEFYRKNGFSIAGVEMECRF